MQEVPCKTRQSASLKVQALHELVKIKLHYILNYMLACNIHKDKQTAIKKTILQHVPGSLLDFDFIQLFLSFPS